MSILILISIVSAVHCDIARISIGQGALVGRKTKTSNNFEYYEYLQIPYAKPPVADLRFKTPQPPEPWEGERSATESSDKHVCFQFDIFRKHTRGSEDCLYLNVYTPKSATKANKKPVIVYIHGGGYIFGNGIIKKDGGPSFLIEHDMVVVFINYRLGVFGFLSLDIPEAAGNMGLKDQVMALKWIQENIESFGGDKDNVIISGISAGGASVEYLMLSPLSKGLFNKAIILSGSSLNHWAINYEIKNLSVTLARELGYKGSSNDVQAIYDAMFKENTTDLLMASLKISNAPGFRRLYFGFVPSIEKDFGFGDTFLSEYPYDILKEGRFHKLPVMRGFCEYEGYISFTGSKSKEVNNLVVNKDFTALWGYDLNPKDKIDYNMKFTKVYFNDDKNNKETAAVHFFGDFDFISGILTSSKLMSANGINSYVYEFAYDGNMNMLKKMFKIDRKGAAHADDAAYIFDIFDQSQINVTLDDKKTSNRLTQMWANFAKTGNPTPNTTDLLPYAWLAYSIHEQNFLVINKDLQLRTAYEPERIAVFESIYEKYHK